MLSILIPIYNYDCCKLAGELSRQATQLQIPFELLAFDDGSARFKEENRSINRMEGCRYVELEQNIGRACIRNKLADAARFSWLLFMDCDSRVIRDNYLSEYVKRMGHTDADVIVGGRVYEPEEKLDPAYRLHWTYGTRREPQPGKGEDKMFMSNNFLIRKSIFGTIRFNEKLTHFCNEDTLFGLELTRNGKKQLYIDNPLLHEGLDKNADFFRKVHGSTQNLIYIWQHMLTPEEASRIRVIRCYRKVKKYGLAPVVGKITSCLEPVIRTNLLGNRPDLRWMDIYKLGIWCREAGLNRQ